MIDQLIALGKEQLSGQLSQEAGLNPAQIEQSFGVAQHSFLDTLKEQALGGNVSGVLSLFNGEAPIDLSNPIVKDFAKNLTTGLMTKIGIAENTAKTVSDTVVPFLIERFSSKETGTASNPLDLMKLMGVDPSSALKGVLGGAGGDLLKNLGGFFK